MPICAYIVYTIVITMFNVVIKLEQMPWYYYTVQTTYYH
jgi:hypothetical protein